ncbi:MAG: plasmid partitioning protein RepA [Chelatococcus sp.]|jgi:chromosome partitioning protein|uniref:plasmid partitioning protein RepA n=1 Tax=unclassified Chelatococcus TaxID=2638111 RepID=UPI001BCF76AF|nr:MULTISPECIES: plasmid partitioning protein RepA [unclassified Chelatococcus]CAH1654502.1 putative replication protein A [Hyphomicrobiales bacterium]MBS7742778.1 plasmid partitioning protein RepA [Chelatococcus sp. HY11]MBX3538429.1 plasmid partitioning protein RepA [Chelatococcus sp.]MBX3542104.1 plasmid partitioning protein RepA [Chelatococcus sp.]MCO5075681.1 plasmid partitioning protein RepA [Chelatococcus sp.]
MAQTAPDPQRVSPEDLKGVIQRHSSALTSQLQIHHATTFPPHAQKTIRQFSPAETARLIGIGEGYLRQVAAETPGLSGLVTNGRRTYSVEDIHNLRIHLDRGSRGTRRYLPWRREGEALQVVSVMNFKGGSGKTTTTAHLAQHLALHGYRVLAIDLDPQASLSALFGEQPELDVGQNETLYGAIRYDEEQRPVAEIVRSTYIPDLHLIPGNLELMEFEHDTPRALMTRKAGDTLFFARIGQAIAQVQDLYDVVIIDCPPQLGYLTLSALTAATSVLITIHPQMLDVMSMSQFLAMTGDLLDEISRVGATSDYNWLRYLVTRFEPSDGPQNQMVAFLRSIFNDHVLIHPMLKSTAVSDAGLTNQTLFEVERSQFTRSTYDRAVEAMQNVNGEIEELIRKAWGRSA